VKKLVSLAIVCLCCVSGCAERPDILPAPEKKHLAPAVESRPEPLQCHDGTLPERPGPRPLLTFPCDALPGEPCLTLDGRRGIVVRVGGHPHCDPTLVH
jgi:hypothetical protein